MRTGTKQAGGQITRQPTPDCPGCEWFRDSIKAAQDPESDGFDPSRATDLRVLLCRHLQAIECVVPTVKGAA
ncbi:hypothetical protein ACIA8O_26075 [Kitasatospora sp. NPDC051853]|uniref:hypothetical protein n=1 Tax=Kitasatospora sp. NPDC051853 TaxID=3364058 RepID=UPI003793E33D